MKRLSEEIENQPNAKRAKTSSPEPEEVFFDKSAFTWIGILLHFLLHRDDPLIIELCRLFNRTSKMFRSYVLDIARPNFVYKVPEAEDQRRDFMQHFKRNRAEILYFCPNINNLSGYIIPEYVSIKISWALFSKCNAAIPRSLQKLHVYASGEEFTPVGPYRPTKVSRKIPALLKHLYIEYMPYHLLDMSECTELLSIEAHKLVSSVPVNFSRFGKLQIVVFAMFEHGIMDNKPWPESLKYLHVTEISENFVISELPKNIQYMDIGGNRPHIGIDSSYEKLDTLIVRCNIRNKIDLPASIKKLGLYIGEIHNYYISSKLKHLVVHSWGNINVDAIKHMLKHVNPTIIVTHYDVDESLIRPLLLLNGDFGKKVWNPFLKLIHLNPPL